ncbi:aldolase/citrate lyase family protein [Rhizobium ruizarguesonis]
MAMIETVDAIDNLDEMLKVDGIDVFFIGPGDLSQNTEAIHRLHPSARHLLKWSWRRSRSPSTRAAQRARLQTLVTADELLHWLRKGVQFFYIHTDPFLRRGIAGIRQTQAR